MSIINDIENISHELARVEIPKHPSLPDFNQFMLVHGVVISLKNDYLKVNYDREFQDSDGNVINIKIDSPEWIIGKENKTDLLDSGGNIVTDENGDAVMVGSINYLNYLIQNKLSHFTDLIKGYAEKFINDNIDKFNQ